MASPTTYFVVQYDTEDTGPYVALSTTLLSWTASTGYIVSLIDDGTTGQMLVALISGTIPTSALVLTQGATTSNCVGPAANGDSELLLYPAYFRNDVAVSAAGAVTWTGPALGATHSLLFDGQTGNVVAGEILTFVDGQSCEVITVVSDAGASGELDVRWISNIDLEGFPEDNDTFTGDIIGDGALNGLVHDRAYRTLHIHRLLADLNDDEKSAGDDVWSVIDATPSARSTDDIIILQGGVTINDEVSRHMYGGSISQASGDTLYSGLAVGVTSPNAETVPVLIQDDAIVTEYWGNAYMPDSIKGAVRVLRKTRDEGADIDGKRVRGALLEFNDFYFFGGTTLGTGETGLALFSSDDGNNQTAAGTVAGAPYNTIVITEGYQLLDYDNGNGPTPYAWELDIGSASKAQAYERTKYVQRRGTAETINGRDAQLLIGVNLDFTFDGGTGTFVEDEIVSWGQAEIVYSSQAVSDFILGEVIDFVGSGAKGRVISDEDNGTDGTLMVAMEGTVVPLATDTILAVTSGTTADVDTVVSNAAFGTALLLAYTGAGATGDLYMQLLTGTVPADGQTVFAAVSGAVADVDEIGGVNTRTINNQMIGGFTGSDYNTNFGWGLQVADAQVNDQLLNLLGVVQQPPNNQQGISTGLAIGDYVTHYPWNGSTTDVNGDPLPTFAQMALAIALTGASTIVDVGTGNIPDNTPPSGFLRIERDSDNEMDLVEYASHDGDDEFTLVGTAPGAANIGNNVMVAYLDKVAAAVSESWTAVKGASTPRSIIVETANI